MRLGKDQTFLYTISYVSDSYLFSHGLSYTTFTLSDLTLSKPTVSNGDFNLVASVKVSNAGALTGSEVVQAYISLPSTSELTHPPLQLKGFAKARDLTPGADVTLRIVFDKYAVSYWSELYDTWVVEKGLYGLHVGTCSDKFSLATTFEVPQAFEWRGL